MKKHKTKNVHCTDPSDYFQASKLTLQITPLLSLNSPYPMSSSASLVSFSFTLLRVVTASSPVTQTCLLHIRLPCRRNQQELVVFGVPQAVLGSVAPGIGRSGSIT